MSDATSPQRAAREADAGELLRTIPHAGLAYLSAALANPALGEEHAVLIARSRAATEDLLHRISADPRWARSYAVKTAIVRSPRAPRAVAMNLVRFLFWRDLAQVVEDYFLAPPLRRLAEKYLSERIAELAVGERIALARIAGRGLIHRMLEERDPLVLDALLWNPRLAEQDLLVTVNDSSTPPEVLAIIGGHPRWASRYGLRVTLARNPRTPLSVALGILTSLRASDLRNLAGLPETSRILKLACDRVLGDAAWQRRQAAKEEGDRPP